MTEFQGDVCRAYGVLAVLLAALLFLALGCAPELRQVKFLHFPPPRHCLLSEIHPGFFWQPTQRVLTCADENGRRRDVPTGESKALREMLGPMGELFDKVMIPVGPAL